MQKADLLNILPALKAENSDKSDKIPDPDFLVSRKESILSYWASMMEFDPLTFTRRSGIRWLAAILIQHAGRSRRSGAW